MSCYRFRVHGRVQGVSYRVWTRALAHRLGVVGEVCNVLDGTVEGRVEGPADALDTFVSALADGSGMARVTRVEIAPEPEQGVDEFTISPTRGRPSAEWGD